MGKGSRETRFGIEVGDPYRWLEEESDETRAWQDAQNRATDEYFARCEGMNELKTRVRELLEVGFCEVPVVAGSRAFYTRREGTAQQPRLMVREAGTERVLLDAEALSSDATDALDWWYASPKGTRVAWGRSHAGSEQSVLHIRDATTGRDLPDRIEGTQHCTVAWVSESGFYYSRHEPNNPYDSRLYFHEIGRDPKDDALVFGEGRDKTDVPQPVASPCGRFLAVVVQQGWTRCELWLRRLDGLHPFVAIATGGEATFDVIARREALYVLTNSGAPRYRLFRVDWENPTRAHWQEVLRERDDVLTSVAVTNEHIVGAYLRDASSVLVARDRDDDTEREIALPTLGTATAFASPDDDDVYVGFTSFAVPLGVWRVGKDAKLEPWAEVASQVPAAITVERRFARSKDGTRIPMFVVRSSKRASRTVVYGYGGFNVNQTPAFSVRVLAFVERGGVWVSTVLRGGGEYGEAWHRAGMLEQKQNVFDDFYACAEAISDGGANDEASLAAVGGSNGGLLVCAAATQRPELFDACIALVPLADMLRYHLFRLGAFWIKEYGSPDDADAFRVLEAYSPVHHVKPAAYPSMLLWAAESDSRVDPMHARKMAAAVQAATTSKNPALLRVETNAGHGMGKPTSKVADQLAAEITFLEHELGKKRAPRT